MKRNLFIALAALFVVGSAPAVASAQTPAELKKAQGHFQKGAEWFTEGEYAKAVVEFISGHSLAPNAMFLYNVSLSYERLGKYEDALAAAEGATEHDGMPPEVAVRNQARIHSLQAIVSAQDVAEDVQEAVASTEEGEGEGDGEPVLVEQSDGITGLGWAGLGLTAVGGGLAIAGVLTNSAIMADVDAYETAAANGDRQTYDSLRDEIEGKQKRGQLFYAIGAGAAGVGVTLFLIDLFTGTEMVPATAFVFPTADGAVVGATIRFR